MKTLIWDLDDVLNDLTETWLAGFCLSRSVQVPIQEIKKNPPFEILGISKHEYLNSLDDFRRSSEGKTLSPNPDVLAWFERAGGSFRHIVLTATPAFNASNAASWVFSHFGNWIQCFGFVPSPRETDRFSGCFSNKGEFLQWVRAGDIFIDDHPIELYNHQFLHNSVLSLFIF